MEKELKGTKRNEKGTIEKERELNDSFYSEEELERESFIFFGKGTGTESFHFKKERTQLWSNVSEILLMKEFIELCSCKICNKPFHDKKKTNVDNPFYKTIQINLCPRTPQGKFLDVSLRSLATCMRNYYSVAQIKWWFC